MNELLAALQTLRDKRTSQQEAIHRLDAAIAQLEAITGQGDGGSVPLYGTENYEGLGIADAAVRYMKEKQGPASTRDIADTIRMRGVKTASKNYTATVYAVLAGAHGKIFRTPDGLWDIVGRAEREAAKQEMEETV